MTERKFEIYAKVRGDKDSARVASFQELCNPKLLFSPKRFAVAVTFHLMGLCKHRSCYCCPQEPSFPHAGRVRTCPSSGVLSSVCLVCCSLAHRGSCTPIHTDGSTPSPRAGPPPAIRRIARMSPSRIAAMRRAWHQTTGA